MAPEGFRLRLVVLKVDLDSDSNHCLWFLLVFSYRDPLCSSSEAHQMETQAYYDHFNQGNEEAASR